MNQATFEHPKLNNGRPTVIKTPMSEEEFKLQWQEIFEDDCYRPALERKKKKDLVIIDIGGNMGLSVNYFAPYAKQIYVLEPSGAYYDALVENTKHLPNVKTFKLAISASSQHDYIYDNNSNGRPETFFGEGSVKEKVTTVTLEKFMEDNKIDHVDVLKFDAEGAEFIVFPSMGFINVASKIDFIIGETHYFHNFVPEHIPMMLEESDFTTTWSPNKNIFRKVGFNGDSKWINKDFIVWFSTIFMAERKHDTTT